MKPLTSKQRDWIMGLLSMVVTLEGYTDIDMVKALAANTAEDEPDMVYCPFCDHEWDCRFSLLCKCSPNQIALRKIEEYLNTKPHPEQMNELHVFYNWLQQEDE